MAHCHEMQVGEVYVCRDCGLELKVVKACRDAGTPEESCACTPCQFICCGEELVKKEE